MIPQTKLSSEYYAPWAGLFPHPVLGKEEKKKERWERIKEAKESQLRLFDGQEKNSKSP